VAGTFTIPLVTLNNGAHTFGPANVADADTRVVLTIDRTVVNGLNSLTAASTIEILVEQSNDGGTSWFELIDGTIFGGLHAQFHGPNPAISEGVTVTFAPGTSRQARGTLTVAGGPIAVQGTLTTS